MAGSVHDQAHLAGLFDPGAVARLFGASAEIRAMLLVEGALAKVQGVLGDIPELSGAAIFRAANEVQIDPGALARETAQNGVSVPALVAAFRTEMQAPEHAQYIHWGATSQDIIDTGLMLRLRQAMGVIDAHLSEVLTALAGLAVQHAKTPMPARTWAQVAAPTSFGAVVASWGWPLLATHKRLKELYFPVSLSGAVGTGTALGADPNAVRRDLAEALKLGDLGRSWHTDRTPILDIATVCSALCTALATLGTDLIAQAQSEVGEVSLGASGASSTMPQKQNPVAPSVLVATARTVHGLEAVLKGASVHQFQRDGVAWFTEWMVLPQIVLGAATSAKTASGLCAGLVAQPEQMMQNTGGDGLIFAEALAFELAKSMPRPDAVAEVKALSQKVRAGDGSLPEVARAAWPDLPARVFDAAQSLGTGPEDAQAFATAVASDT